MLRFSFFLVILYSCSFHSQGDDLPSEVTLGVTSWCPYTCVQQPKQGAVVQYVTEILQRHHIKLIVEFSPWTRAIKKAQLGSIDGLLTSAYDVSRNLSMTHVPLGYYQTCFVTRRENSWQYLSPLALGANRLAIVQDYKYGYELDKLIDTNKYDTMGITGANVIERLIRLLTMKRVDIIVIDLLEFNWINGSTLAQSIGLHQAGCLPKEPYYVGLNRSMLGRGALIELLDVEFDKPNNRRRLQQLLVEASRK